MLVVMKKIVVLLLLSVLMRDGTGAGIVSSLRAAAVQNGDNAIASATTIETTVTDKRSAASVNNEQKPSGISASDPALASTGSNVEKADAADATDAAGGDVRAQWTASLLARNPFIPFGTVAKKTEEKEKKSDSEDWGNKRAEELHLQSVTEYKETPERPAHTDFGIEVISTGKRCWISSDRVNDKVPFVYVSHRKEERADKAQESISILTVRNTANGSVMEIRQQERKQRPSSGGGSYGGGYGDYGSSYYDDDFFPDFD